MAGNGQGGSKWDAFQRYGSAAIRHIRIRNVLNAPVLVTITVGPACIAVAAITDGLMAYCMIGLAAVCVFNLFAGGRFFAFKDPSRLQTEDHIERMAAVHERIETQRDGGAVDAVQGAIVETPTAGAVGTPKGVGVNTANTHEEGDRIE